MREELDALGERISKLETEKDDMEGQFNSLSSDFEDLIAELEDCRGQQAMLEEQLSAQEWVEEDKDGRDEEENI